MDYLASLQKRSCLWLPDVKSLNPSVQGLPFVLLHLRNLAAVSMCCLFTEKKILMISKKKGKRKNFNDLHHNNLLKGKWITAKLSSFMQPFSLFATFQWQVPYWLYSFNMYWVHIKSGAQMAKQWTVVQPCVTYSALMPHGK